MILDSYEKNISKNSLIPSLNSVFKFHFRKQKVFFSSDQLFFSQALEKKPPVMKKIFLNSLDYRKINGSYYRYIQNLQPKLFFRPKLSQKNFDKS